MRESAASALAQCLEVIQEGQQSPAECLSRYPERGDELAPLIETASLLRAAPEIVLRPAFRQTARRRLLARLPERRPVIIWDQLVARWPVAPGTLNARIVAAVLMALLVLGTLLGGGRMVSASGKALPGDALYPVKVAVEESRLALSGDERAFGLYLEFAQMRVDELERLSAMQRFETVPAATSRLERQVQSAAGAVTVIGGQDAARSRVLAEQLDASLTAHRARLVELLETAPTSVRPALERAIQGVDDELEKEDEDRSMDEREDSGPEEDDLDLPDSDTDQRRRHEPDDAGSEGTDSDTEGPESPEDSTTDDGIGDDREDDSGRPQYPQDGQDDTGDSGDEADDPDGEPDSVEGDDEGAYGDEGQDGESDVEGREDKDVDDEDASDEGSDSGGGSDEDEGDDSSDADGGEDGEARDPPDSHEGSGDSSDDSSRSKSGDESRSDGDTSDSRDDDSDRDGERDSDSEQDSGPDGSSGSDGERKDDSKDGSDDEDKDKDD